jgi:hypothetical protein
MGHPFNIMKIVELGIFQSIREYSFDDSSIIFLYNLSCDDIITSTFFDSLLCFLYKKFYNFLILINDYFFLIFLLFSLPS